MPADPGIYSGFQTPRINTPFENLSQILQVRQQQQAVQTGQALEQERRQKLADMQRAQQEDEQYKQLIQSSADLSPDDFLKAVKLKAPEHASAVEKAILDAREKASLVSSHEATAAAAKAQAAKAAQEFIGHAYDQITQANGDPVVTNIVLNGIQDHFPDWAGHVSELRKIAATQGKDAFLSAAKALVPSDISKQRADMAATVAETPGKVAQSAITQQIAAGTKGGLTPDQQRQAAQNAATQRNEQQRIGLEQQRVGLERQRLQQTAPQASDIDSDVRTTLSGTKYLDLGDYQTPKERSAAAAAAKAAGIIPVSKEVGASLAAADTAKQNISAMWAKIESKLPKDPTGRLLAGPGNRLKQFFQTDDDLAAFNSWRAGAIQAVQALVERGMGFRLNKSEIDMIMQNDMPQVTDTVGAAKARVQNMLTLLSNKEKTALTRDRSTLGAGGIVAPTSTEAPVMEWIRDPKTGQLIKKGPG